jgi:NAD(P)-dependent dehydrogenase (short-subunit alcohol dehydrogenase family)
MTTLRGATAAITGAGGGIGAALALKLAARGADVALADRNEAGREPSQPQLETTEKLATTHGSSICCSAFVRPAIGLLWSFWSG